MLEYYKASISFSTIGNRYLPCRKINLSFGSTIKWTFILLSASLLTFSVLSKRIRHKKSQTAFNAAIHRLPKPGPYRAAPTTHCMSWWTALTFSSVLSVKATKMRPFWPTMRAEANKWLHFGSSLRSSACFMNKLHLWFLLWAY